MKLEPRRRCHPAIFKIQHMLAKIDGLRLPLHSRHDIERILTRQATKELDYALPSHVGHGLRTARIADTIAQALGLTDEESHDLTLASYLHDVGLLTLPDHVIQGTGYLNAKEYCLVQTHPRIGASLLEPFAFLRRASVLIAHHHERWDGSGYPYGIRGPFIPLGARILAIADAYDAMNVPEGSDSITRTLIKLRILQVASGTQFDPGLVDLFCHAVSRFQSSRLHFQQHEAHMERPSPIGESNET